MVANSSAATDSRDALIECVGLEKRFATRGGRRPGSAVRSTLAVGPIDLVVQKGQVVSLLGPSGCGKSTLLRLIAGLMPASAGYTLVERSVVKGAETQMGMAFQKPVLLEWMNVMENIVLQGASRPEISSEEMRKRAGDLLEMVGLKREVGIMRPSQLSGGMQQRVSICRAIVHNPPILLMDEPFGALDALTRDQIVVDLEHIWGNRTVIVVTHSIEEAVAMSDRVIVLTPAPARIDMDLQIDLPRPRGFAARATSKFVLYTDQIREAFTRRGVLKG